MALTIRQLSSDTSFLLSFEPVFPESVGDAINSRPFTILLDPVITAPPPPSSLPASKVPTVPTTTTNTTTTTTATATATATTDDKPAPHTTTITSLSDLPEPDLVVVSQLGSAHCDEATLRQLPGSGTRTLILAEPAAAGAIRNWRHFERGKVRGLEGWEDPRLTGGQAAARVPVPAVVAGGPHGEVTVSLVLPEKAGKQKPAKQAKQKKKSGKAKSCCAALTGTAAGGVIGITYKPPTVPGLQPKHIAIPAAQQLLQQQSRDQRAAAAQDATPPTTPGTNAGSGGNGNSLEATSLAVSISDSVLSPPSSTPPISPRSLRSVQSAVTLLPSPTQPTCMTNTTTTAGGATAATNSPAQQQQRPSSSSPSTTTTIVSTTAAAAAKVTAVAAAAAARPLSVVFAPHGTAYPHLITWTTSHLVAEAALPLTALLHPMDGVATATGTATATGHGGGPNYHPRWSWPSSLRRLRHGGHGNKNGSTSVVLAGADITSRLAARVWVSAHDGGNMRRWSRRSKNRDKDRDKDRDRDRGNGSSAATEVMRLGGGDEVSVCADGLMWTSFEAEDGGDSLWPPEEDEEGEQEEIFATEAAASNNAPTATDQEGGDQKEEEEEEEELRKNKKENGGGDINKPATEAKTKDGPGEGKKSVPIAVTAAVTTVTTVTAGNDRDHATPKKRGGGLRTKASFMRLGMRGKVA